MRIPTILSLLFSTVLAMGQEARGFLLLGSTIGPIDAGIVEVLEDRFEKESGIRVRHVGAGTGAALDMARRGGVDLVLVHAKSLEEKFIADGFGTRRIPLMYNDFVVLGPAADPAGIRGGKDVRAALKRLAAKEAPFLTRGDKSGTHVAELELWAKAGIKPDGAWYRVFERGAEGNAPTLRAASQADCYTVIDRATYLALKKEIRLEILVEGDEALLNHISLIPVSPSRFPRTAAKEAEAFVAWLVHPDRGQKVIAEFGKDRYGAPLFFPESEAWRARQGK